MGVLYNKKAKCQGCKALKTTKLEGSPVMECSLGFCMSFQLIDGDAVQPKPEEKCYKPLTEADLKKSRELVANKKKKDA